MPNSSVFACSLLINSLPDCPFGIKDLLTECPPKNISSSVHSTLISSFNHFAPSRAFLAKTSISSLSPPAFSTSFLNNSILSLIFSFSCNQFIGAAYSAPEIKVLPPIKGNFSSTTTLAPASLAFIAEIKPAPPDPTTTTSTFISLTSYFSFNLRLLFKIFL